MDNLMSRWFSCRNIATALLALLLAAGCTTGVPTPALTPAQTVPGIETTGPDPTVAPARATPMGLGTESRISEAMGSVPLEFSGGVVEFADYHRSRAVKGLEDADSSEDVYRMDPRVWVGIFDGVRLHPHLNSRIQRMIDLMGVDVFAFDLSIWSWQDGNNSPTFMLVQAPFDREVVAGKLQALDYKEADYAGTLYYWLDEDFAPGLLTHPLGVPLNRVAFLDGRLAAAPSTGILEQLIDVHHGESPSLLESPPHRALAEAVGEGLVGGAFVPPGRIVENWKSSATRSVGWLDRGTGDTRPVDRTDRGSVKARAAARLDRYLAGPDQWGQLSSYDLALLGYRVRGDAEETVFALYYPDPDAAAGDSGELEKRWNSFYYDPTGARAESEEVPATLSCSPFSTTVIERSGDSVLIGTCPVLRSEEWDVTVKGPSLWSWLFGTGELQFLVRGLDDLN